MNDQLLFETIPLDGQPVLSPMGNQTESPVNDELLIGLTFAQPSTSVVGLKGKQNTRPNTNKKNSDLKRKDAPKKENKIKKKKKKLEIDRKWSKQDVDTQIPPYTGNIPGMFCFTFIYNFIYSLQFSL